MTKLIFEVIDFDNYYYYDETSPTCLRWKVDILTSCGKRTKAQVGKVAGGMTKKSGYYQTRLMQKTFQVHRIIYKLFYGNIPRTLNIDHLDRNKMNNKISNLRATNLNNRNLPKQNRNKSGFCGVQRTHNGWQATWKRLDGKNGTKYFSSLKYGDMQAKSLAVAARELAIIKLNAQGAGYTDIHGR